MRIVAGRHKGRPLAAPDGRIARPTADRARESLFNMLANRLDWDGLTVLDAFAGTGGLGLEALSRGAARAFFMENHRASLAALQANVATLNEGARARILRCDATRPPAAEAACDLVMLDPPYGQNLAIPCLEALLRQGWVAAAAVVVVEVAAKEDFTPPPGFTLDQERIQGAARLIFLSLL